MPELQEYNIHCPYCGEAMSVLVDPEECGHSYTEDCQVCCAPIIFTITENDFENIEVAVRREDE